MVEEQSLEFQAGSEFAFNFQIDPAINLTSFTTAKFAVFSDFGKAPLFTATSNETSGIRVSVIPASNRIDVILPGAATSGLVTKGSEFTGRWQAEIAFDDGSQLVFGRGEITIFRDGVP